MTFADYLLDSVLVLLVLRQIRWSRWDRGAVLLPLGIVALVAWQYLHTVPTAGADLVLVLVLALVGVGSGLLSALTTRVRVLGGQARVKAGWIAAGVWVTTMGLRFGFAVWASGGGDVTLAHFDAAHGLDDTVWTAALVLMALGEVITRVGVLSLRVSRARHEIPAARPMATV